MAAAAVLRRSAGRALRRPSSFPHALLGKQQQQPQLMRRSPPVENITPRRLYSPDCDVIKTEMNKIIRPAAITVLERISKNFDKLDQIYDKQIISLRRLEDVMRENIKRDRRRKKVLVRGLFFIGIAIFVKKQFFGANQEDKAMSESN